MTRRRPTPDAFLTPMEYPSSVSVHPANEMTVAEMKIVRTIPADTIPSIRAYSR
jgi:hypothetical protein